MKEKIFYIVNLDKKRISVLSLFLVGLLFSFFFLGVSVGKGNAMALLHRNKLSNQIEVSINENNKPPIDNAIVEPLLDKNSIQEKIPTSDSKEIPIATIEKESTVILANKAPEHNVIELNSVPKEDIKTVAAIHSIDARKITAKHSPKKIISSSKDTKTIFSLQLAAFSNKIDAENFIKKINIENPSLKSKPFILTKGKFFLVRMGFFEDKNQLKKLLDNLKIDTSIRKNVILVKNS